MSSLRSFFRLGTLVLGLQGELGEDIFTIGVLPTYNIVDEVKFDLHRAKSILWGPTQVSVPAHRVTMK